MDLYYSLRVLPAAQGKRIAATLSAQFFVSCGWEGVISAQLTVNARGGKGNAGILRGEGKMGE